MAQRRISKLSSRIVEKDKMNSYFYNHQNQFSLIKISGNIFQSLTIHNIQNRNIQQTRIFHKSNQIINQFAINLIFFLEFYHRQYMIINILYIGIEKTHYFKSHESNKKSNDSTSMNPLNLKTFFQQKVNINDIQVQLKLWNPSGQEKYLNLRELSFYFMDDIVIAWDPRTQQKISELESYYQQIRKSENTRNIKIVIVSTVESRAQWCNESKIWIQKHLQSDDMLELCENQSSLLQTISKNHIEQQKKKMMKRQACCSIY